MHIPRIFVLAAILIGSIFQVSGQVKFIENEDKIDVMYRGQLITSYLTGQDLLKPCLYPIKTLDGQIITRQFPFQKILGESTDHPHHTGLYFTYGSRGEVNGNSFWNMHDTPPMIRHIRIVNKMENADNGSIATVSHWVGKSGEVILKESRRMSFDFTEASAYSIDFNIALEAMDENVTFEDTKEGMFAIRVADWMCEEPKGSIEGTGKYTNAKGSTTEENIWGRRSEWVKLEGVKEGNTYGIAIFHHPESVNFPTYWHARGYGCFAANPVGQFDFQKEFIDNPEKRNLVIKKGESTDFGFRVSIYEGSKEIKELEAEFQSFESIDL